MSLTDQNDDRVPVTGGPVVVSGAGPVRGRFEDGVAVFRGIPYARADRFGAPQPTPAWTGVRECTEFGAAAPQPPSRNVRYAVREPSSEDCLHLNVWSPAPDAGRRPVLVYLHGGGFRGGAGSVRIYDGRQLAERDVVAVTVNYRLGALGLLQLEDHPANRSLLDQLAALQWVRQNIEAFGGDPDRVTVMGSSAGGTSVTALLTSARARGLMHSAIAISCSAGRALTPGVARGLTDDFLDRVGARDEAQLLELPVEQLIVDATTFRSRSALQPIIEPNVLPVDPRQAVRDGAGAGIPLLIGYAADEQGGRHRDTVPAREALRRPGVPLERPDPDGSFDLATLSPQPDVAEVYRRSLTAAGRPSEPVDLYVALSSDLSIAAPSQRYAADQSRRAPTYLFCFAWPSPVESYAFGAYHGLLTPLLFGNRADPDWADVLNGLPDTVAGTLFDAVVSFVSGRQPWARYDPDRRETMVFDQDARVVADPERDRRLITGG